MYSAGITADNDIATRHRTPAWPKRTVSRATVGIAVVSMAIVSIARLVKADVDQPVDGEAQQDAHLVRV